ncbi:hypothetical protein M427DRAFT_55739, partial [Gonapodya prolifera JEL478]
MSNDSKHQLVTNPYRYHLRSYQFPKTLHIAMSRYLLSNSSSGNLALPFTRAAVRSDDVEVEVEVPPPLADVPECGDEEKMDMTDGELESDGSLKPGVQVALRGLITAVHARNVAGSWRLSGSPAFGEPTGVIAAENELEDEKRPWSLGLLGILVGKAITMLRFELVVEAC